jgi:hypothetical protein
MSPAATEQNRCSPFHDAPGCPVAGHVVAAVEVDARHTDVLRVAGGQRRARDQVEPVVAVDVDRDDIAVVGRIEHALAADDRGRARQRGGAIGQHAALVHQQHVGELAGRGERLLAHDHEVGVTVLVEVGPGVVLLLGVGGAESRSSDQTRGGLVLEGHPLGARGGAAGDSRNRGQVQRGRSERHRYL